MYQPTVTVSSHPRYAWEVNVPPHVFGSRQRHRTNDRGIAQATALAIKEQIRNLATVPVTRDEALLLARWRGKLTLAQMDAALSGKVDTVAPPTPHILSSICDDYVQAQVKKHRAGVIGDLRLRDCERLSRLVRLSVLGDRAVREISQADAQAWLDSLDGASDTRRNLQRMLQAILNYAVSLGKLDRSPAAGTYLAHATKAAVGILTPSALGALLDESAAHPPVAWALVFGAFMGLRPSEIGRLDWADVQPNMDPESDAPGNLYVGPGKTAAAERWVKFTPPLQSFDWTLKPSHGPVVTGANLRQHRADAVARAGVTVPRNGMRHSYASHHLVAFKEPHQTAAEMGHTSTQQTFAAYRRAVNEQQAASYWALAFDHGF